MEINVRGEEEVGYQKVCVYPGEKLADVAKVFVKKNALKPDKEKVLIEFLKL